MKITIDTNKKEITIEESISISELISFLKDDYKDYKIVSKHTISIQKEVVKDNLERGGFLPTQPYNPPYNPYPFNPGIYC